MSGLRYSSKAEINITPLVDVFLILLVVFLLVSPLIAHRLTVSVPKLGVSGLPQVQNTLRVSLNASAELEVGGQLVAAEDLQALIEPNSTVELAADQKLTYAQVALVLAQIEEAKPAAISLVVQ